QELNEVGQFNYRQGEVITCTFGSIQLLNHPTAAPSASVLETPASMQAFDVVEQLITPEQRSFAGQLFAGIDKCAADNQQYCVDGLDSFDIAPFYGRELHDPEVQAQLNQEQTDAVDKAPSSHVDNAVVPAVTPGASSDLNSGFVSPSAEAALSYTPAVPEPTTSVLRDVSGRPLAGVAYFTASSRGVTELDGVMEYNHGEVITLGIDTFTFGEVKGNQLEYKLSDVTDNVMVKQNIDSLVARYARQNGDATEFPPTVQEVFALYPNAVNEIINLALPNGAPIGDTGFSTPDEFNAQFASGLAAQIDQKLAAGGLRLRHAALRTDDASQIRADLAQLYSGVEQFHVFHSQASFYAASGYARLMRTLNVSNRAFPVLMPRNDKNHWLATGQEQAWQRDGQTPYLLDTGLLPEAEVITLARPPLVSAENMSFGLPGMSVGRIGQGKVVFMGNGQYPSVLSCPDSYWASNQLSIAAGVCTYTNAEHSNDPTLSPQHDGGSMQRFMQNLLTWLHPAYAQGANPLSVGTNIATAYRFQHNFKNNGDLSPLGYPFFVDARFNLDLQALSKDGFSGLDPATSPVLLVQSFALKGVETGYEWETLSDIAQPLLSAADVDALIQYVNQGGHVVFMDSISDLNPEPIAKLADMAGVALGGDNVAKGNTLQGNCGTSHYCQSLTPTTHGLATQRIVTFEIISNPEDALAPGNVTINQDGSLTWAKLPKVSVAT
ncbi:MAG: DUF4092 domain-containing protein, partial [Aeromonas sp.]